MIKKIDHIVITTADVKACLAFYQKLGFVAKEPHGRYELFAGDFKINVHEKGKELNPRARNVQPGSGDFCFEIEGSILEYESWLKRKGVEIELGIVSRTGVNGDMRSIYLRDPDENLVEISSYS